MSIGLPSTDTVLSKRKSLFNEFNLYASSLSFPSNASSSNITTVELLISLPDNLNLSCGACFCLNKIPPVLFTESFMEILGPAAFALTQKPCHGAIFPSSKVPVVPFQVK